LGRNSAPPVAGQPSRNTLEGSSDRSEEKDEDGEHLAHAIHFSPIMGQSAAL
jgi:hypothetical protein